jgi:hypothetical protein
MGSLTNFQEMQLRALVQSLANQQFGHQQQPVVWLQPHALMQQQQQHAATAQILLQQQLQQQPSPQQLHAIYTQQQLHQLQQQQLQMEALSVTSSIAGVGAYSPQQQNQFTAPLLQPQPQQHFGPLTGAGASLPLHQAGPESSSLHLDMLSLYEEVSKALLLAARQQGNEDVEQQLQVRSFIPHSALHP